MVWEDERWSCGERRVSDLYLWTVWASSGAERARERAGPNMKTRQR